MCAAGCLIADDEYTPDMDTGGVYQTSTEWAALVREQLVPVKHSFLIEDLQNVHDSFRPEEWHRELITTGQAYSLDIAFLDI
jgi:hypothetical protein